MGGPDVEVAGVVEMWSRAAVGAGDDLVGGPAVEVAGGHVGTAGEARAIGEERGDECGVVRIGQHGDPIVDEHDRDAARTGADD